MGGVSSRLRARLVALLERESGRDEHRALRATSDKTASRRGEPALFEGLEGRDMLALVMLARLERANDKSLVEGMVCCGETSLRLA